MIAEREKRVANDVAIIRLEQLAPFPFFNVQEEMASYTNAKMMWVQEEPKNQGAWDFVAPRFNNLFEKVGIKQRISYSGRDISASTATGYGKTHAKELDSLLTGAFA